MTQCFIKNITLPPKCTTLPRINSQETLKRYKPTGRCTDILRVSHFERNDILQRLFPQPKKRCNGLDLYEECDTVYAKCLPFCMSVFELTLYIFDEEYDCG